LHDMGYWPAYLKGKEWFDTWGIWAVFVAGFSPIPYKIFTISAGVAALRFPGFVIASLIGRGARFFMVAGLIVAGGQRMEEMIPKYVERIGWGVVAIVVAIGLFLTMRS
ncbi:MAG: YqaA family protein, partial [Woeseiaceae bacterium]